MKEEYIIKEYPGKYYLEKFKSQGIWKIIGEYKTKEEAEEELKKMKGEL